MNTRKHNDAIVVALLSGRTMERADEYEAARILFDVYLPMVYAYLRKYFRGCIPSLHDSIVVETVERVTNSLHKFDPNRSMFTTYLIGFARRVALEKLRKELNICFLEELEEMPVPEPTKSSQGAKTLLQELLRGPYAACLESLDEKFRMLIEMAIEGIPPETYQAHFDVTRITYRKRKQRALEELRERILVMGPGPVTE